MQQIVVNKCFGGFGLSHKAMMRYAELKGIQLYPWIDDITKEVYGERALIGNKEILHHYSTSPIIDGEYEDNSYFSESDIPRDDPTLIKLIGEMGEEANGTCAELKIVEIPDGVEWEIEEYDGSEWIAEKHRTW